MREFTELERQNEEFLAKKGIPFTTIMLTDNILSHAIFDANRQIVKFLKEQGIHDYEQQENGKDSRAFVTTHILTFKEEIVSNTSMYKAGTRGDKRMWFGAEVLPFAEGGNIFVIMAHEGELYVINESKLDIELCCTTSFNNPIKRLVRDYHKNFA